MHCQACGTENRAGRKFCRECGAALAMACEVCGAPNHADDKFCGECGGALAPSGPSTEPAEPRIEPARAEQRFVSVLFADMVGYSTLSEHRDSEDIRDLLTTYFDRSREIVERFGGVVDKFIGDAVMGIWGAAAAREDDAQRAVRAALELVDMVGALGEELGVPELALRAGVNSGLTSVGPGGNEKGLVVGDLVNVASRLESLAAPGTVNVGPGTEAVTNRAIDYEFLGEQSLKGKSETVPVWRALRVAAMRSGRADDEIRRPPFVGREGELRLLKDALTGVAADHRARLVSIVGEAGVGKTRLAEEFRNHIDGYTETIYWHWGRSPSYGDGVTFWALGEMVRRRAGILETEDPARSRTRLRTTIAEFVTAEEDRQWIEPRLAGLLGLADMPSGTRAELFAALRGFFQHIAARGPAVLVFEDLHWADPGLLDFVAELVERSTRSPILVVTLARPDLLDRRPAWGTQHRSSMSVRLSPLSDPEMNAMLEQYLPGIGDEVITRIADRAAGFPLYAVEIVRMLTASGDLRRDGSDYRYDGDASAMALPETLQTVIGARLDRLDPDSRALLQDGSVLGQSFALETISSLREQPTAEIEEALQPLVHLELLELEDDPRSPERGQYRFVQALIHEVAYRRLSRADRRAKHLAAAAYFAEREDPELAGVVAGHYMGAYEATPEGPEKDEMVARAIDSLTSAADRAAELQSHLQAVELLEQAIDLAPDESLRTEQRLRAAYAASLHNDPDRGLAHLEAARAHFENTGDVEGIRRIATAASAILNSHFQTDKALEVIRPIYEDLEAVDDLVSIQLASEAARSLSLAFTETDALAAITAADRLLPAAETLGDAEVVLHAVISKATAMSFLGRRVEAYALLRGAAYEAEQRGLLEAVVRALNNLSGIMTDRNPQEALRVAEHLESIVARTQQHAWLVRVAANMSECEIQQGAYEGALERLDAFAEEELSPIWSARFGLNRAVVGYRRTGGDQYLADWQEQAAALFDGQHDPQVQAAGLLVRATRARDAGDWAEAFELAAQVDPALDWGGIGLAATAAAWLRDSTRLEIPEQHLALTENTPPGLADYVAAIRLALGDRTDEAVVRFARVLDLWSNRLLADDLALARATFARLIGLENPAAREAAEAAARWLDETGSHGLRAAWADALPPADSAAVATG